MQTRALRFLIGFQTDPLLLFRMKVDVVFLFFLALLLLVQVGQEALGLSGV